MDSLHEPARETPIRGRWDVIIAGGGTAGIIAALAVREMACTVLVLERSGVLGGHIPAQFLEHSVGWYDANGTKITGGLPDRLVDALVAAGGSPGHVPDDTRYTTYRLPVNHEVFKAVVSTMLADAGVDTRLDAPVASVIQRDDGIAVVAETKGGRAAHVARVAIDCTGDGDLCHLAGAAFHDSDLTQPVSQLFKLGGVDYDGILGYVRENPTDFKWNIDADALAADPHLNLWGFTGALAQGHKSGRLSLLRNEIHLAGDRQTGEAVVNFTRVAGDATEPEAMAKADPVLRRQMLEFLDWFRASVPGFENAFLAGSASAVGVRESRRVKGLATLRDEDVRTSRQPPDAVAQGGFPMDSHDPLGASMDGTEKVSSAYGIPFGCFVPVGVDRLLVAGRCISAERKALASARLTGTVMAMGQAVGVAAGLAARADIEPRALDVETLREALRKLGALLA